MMKCHVCNKIMICDRMKYTSKAHKCPNIELSSCICLECYIERYNDTVGSTTYIEKDIKSFLRIGCWSSYTDDNIKKLIVALTL